MSQCGKAALRKWRNVPEHNPEIAQQDLQELQFPGGRRQGRPFMMAFQHHDHCAVSCWRPILQFQPHRAFFSFHLIVRFGQVLLKITTHFSRTLTVGL